MKDLALLGATTDGQHGLTMPARSWGVADLPGSQKHDAFLWKNGKMISLGNLGQTSFALFVNPEEQVVGVSKINDGSVRPFLWEKGGPIVDLNTLVSPQSDIRVMEPYDINDRGEIDATAVLPNGDERAVLLIPDGDCDDDCEAESPPVSTMQPLHRIRQVGQLPTIRARQARA
jgi:probable HAF family extracellular repeat protein